MLGSLCRLSKKSVAGDVDWLAMSTISDGRRMRLRCGGIRHAKRERPQGMRRTLAWVVVAVVLISGCGGGSDTGRGGSDSSDQSAGDRQYIDPFQQDGGGACLSQVEVQEVIDRIASRLRNSERKQRAIQAVRHRAC
jgi:hypothetical protein